MNNLNITPEFIKAVALVKKVNLTELYRYSGICNYYSDSYFLKIVRGVKPVTDKFRDIFSSIVNEQLTTDELIKAIKLAQIL